MKRLITLCLIALGVIASQISIKAQTVSQGIPDRPEASFPNLPNPARVEPIQPGSGLSREPKVVKKGILAPAASDVAQHQFLLSQDKTGLMRLLPREHFDWGLKKVVDRKVPLRGGGAYFSFHHRTHEYGYGSDLSYEQGKLNVGFAGADYGMMTDLGDSPLESISAEDPRASFLLNYKPPRKEQDARLEKRKFSTIRNHGLSGVTVDGIPYQSRVDAVVNHTYLLRSIDYGTSDLLVAFRVVSSGEDGGLTIAWKILKEYRRTELIPD